MGRLIGAALLAALVVGCAAETGTEPTRGDDVGSQTTASPHEESLLGGVVGGGEGLVSGVGQVLGICSPLTCCFPKGAEWQSNPFENGLRALGCTMPAAYTEQAGSSQWWLYSRCPASAKLSAQVAAYSRVAPYYSQQVVNACLLLSAVGDLQLNQVFVEFDPTCASCTPR